MYEWNWQIIWTYKQIFVEGALVTLGLTLVAVVIGTLIGALMAALKRSSNLVLSFLAKFYIEIFRALPILVLLIWIYYVIPILFNWQISGFTAAVVAIALHLSAFSAETIRAGIESIPSGQFESGYALGMNSRQVMIFIVLPQAIKNMIPNLLGLYVNELKNSSLASIIAVNELLHRSNILISNTYRPLEIYTTIALVYLILILPLIYLTKSLEKKFIKGAPPFRAVDYESQT